MSLTVEQPFELPGEEVILKKLAQLPAALFEMLVCLSDKYNSVPGREASQLIRATEFFRLMESQESGIPNLWRKLCEITGDDFQPTKNIPGMIKSVKIEELIGILIDPEGGNLGEEITRYAFAQVHNVINSDLLRRVDELIVSALIWNLADIPVLEGKYPLLLAFAVLCHDHAVGLEKARLKDKLKTWIDAICQDTLFNMESIRANYPKQEYRSVYRLAIEIAWPVPINKSTKNILPPESYIRWGRLRQRIGNDVLDPDRHQAITNLLNSFTSDKTLGLIQVDHVEIILDPSDMQTLWEYKLGASVDDDDPEFQPYPIVVRSTVHSIAHGRRPCPHDLISDRHIACNHHGERFLEIVQDHGVFVTTTYVPNKVKKAIPLASIGIWSRTACNEDDRLREILTDCPVDDVPTRIHGRRSISSPGSVWRNVVALFDPNLPPFKFSYEEYDSSHQINTNAALG